MVAKASCSFTYLFGYRSGNLLSILASETRGTACNLGSHEMIASQVANSNKNGQRWLKKKNNLLFFFAGT